MPDVVQTADDQPKRVVGKPFPKGISGNPTGRPPGALAKATIFAQAAVAGRIKGIVEATITAAENGDVAAQKMIWDRVWPIAKGDTNVTLNQLNVTNMPDIELARRMALLAPAMMRALMGADATQVIDNTEQSDTQPSDADSA